MALPRIILTGASGFIGRHFLERYKGRFEIYGLARRSQTRCGAPFHANIHWYQVDIGDRENLETVIDEIGAGGRVDCVIHLAAHYDFTGEDDPEYWRTNVDGLRNVLDCCRTIGVERFVFSSSLAACDFPEPGQVLTEDTPPDGDHVYAKTKAIGEKMLDEYQDAFPSTIIRFAALFSDWCEYPPVFMFFNTWLSRAWNNRLLGGKGSSAVPYLHVRDAVSFMGRLLQRIEALAHGQVVIASIDGAISHEELFLAATHYRYGDMRVPIHIPKFMVLPGIGMRLLAGRITGNVPFERPWMARYVDKQLTVDGHRTRELLGWEPHTRLEILRRMPFLVENMKAYPADWNRRNRAAMKEVRIRPNLRIYSLLEKHQEEIAEKFTSALTHKSAKGQFPSYQNVDEHEHAWNHRLILRNLMNTIRTRERAVFLSYCRDLATRRIQQGFRAEELSGALEELERICIEVLATDPEAADVLPYLHDNVSITIRFGTDQILDASEQFEAQSGASDS